MTEENEMTTKRDANTTTQPHNTTARHDRIRPLHIRNHDGKLFEAQESGGNERRSNGNPGGWNHDTPESPGDSGRRACGVDVLMFYDALSCCPHEQGPGNPPRPTLDICRW